MPEAIPLPTPIYFSICDFIATYGAAVFQGKDLASWRQMGWWPSFDLSREAVADRENEFTSELQRVFECIETAGKGEHSILVSAADARVYSQLIQLKPKYAETLHDNHRLYRTWQYGQPHGAQPHQGRSRPEGL